MICSRPVSVTARHSGCPETPHPADGPVSASPCGVARRTRCTATGVDPPDRREWIHSLTGAYARSALTEAPRRVARASSLTDDLLEASVTARHGAVPKRHGQGGAIRIVIAILGGVWRPTQVGSDQPDWIRSTAAIGSTPGRHLCTRGRMAPSRSASAVFDDCMQHVCVARQDQAPLSPLHPMNARAARMGANAMPGTTLHHSGSNAAVLQARRDLLQPCSWNLTESADRRFETFEIRIAPVSGTKAAQRRLCQYASQRVSFCQSLCRPPRRDVLCDQIEWRLRELSVDVASSLQRRGPGPRAVR
jgi:hypothetical protein